MKVHIWFALRIVLATAILFSISAFAQSPTTTPGPVPPTLLSAKSVFVSNAGSDSGLFPEPFSGDPDRPYSEFYALLKSSNAFTLAPDPSQADLVLELQLTAPAGPSRGSKQLGAADPVPMFRLVVYDRQSHFILWTETQSIEIALLQKTHDRNFDSALDALFNRFLQVAGKPPVTANTGH